MHEPNYRAAATTTRSTENHPRAGDPNGLHLLSIHPEQKLSLGKQHHPAPRIFRRRNCFPNRVLIGNQVVRNRPIIGHLEDRPLHIGNSLLPMLISSVGVVGQDLSQGTIRRLLKFLPIGRLLSLRPTK